MWLDTGVAGIDAVRETDGLREPKARESFRPRSRPSPVTRVRQCPADFDLVDGDCYFLSTERVGWIEARKKCEVRGAHTGPHLIPSPLVRAFPSSPQVHAH